MKRISKSSNKKIRKTAAFFDVDGTILKATSDLIVAGELLKKGIIKFSDVVLYKYYSLLHKLNLLNIKKIKRFLGFLKGVEQKKAEDIIKKLFDKKVKKLIPKVMLNEIKEHKKNKRIVVLVSNSPEILIKWFKDFLKADIMACSRLEVKNGKYTGKIIRYCYGVHKKACISHILNKIDLKNSYAYSDSYSDMVLFNLVGNKIAVNPDFKLKSYAKKHKWRIIEY